MIVGYAALQAGAANTQMSEPHTALIAAGVQRLFIDVIASGMPRSQLDAAIEVVGSGDLLVSSTVETLARSTTDLLSIVDRLHAKEAALLVLRVANRLPLDTRTVEGRAMLGALAIINMLEQSGSAPTSMGDAPEPVRPRGRPATAYAQSDEVARLHSEGLRATDIAVRLGIGRASVYRILSQGGSVRQDARPDPQIPADLSRATSLARRLNFGHTAG